MTIRALLLTTSLILCVSPLVFGAQKPTLTPKRVALLIGNSAYKESALKNPPNDVKALSQALSEIGFSVTTQFNRTKLEFENDVDEITKDLAKGDICMIFYAGHGQSNEGTNYLIPVDATVSRPQHLKERCVSASYLQSSLEESDASLKVLIFDSCRDPINALSRGSTKGFAKMPATEGTMIAFSTSPGQVALDGEGDVSPYTKNLVSTLKRRPREGLTLLGLFLDTSVAVKNEIGQRPYLEMDASQDLFWLIPPDEQAVATNLGVPKVEWGIKVRPHKDGTGMEVVEVIKGSPAEKGWKPDRGDVYFLLEKGDVIRAINGNLTTDYDSFVREYKFSPATMSVSIFDPDNTKQKNDIIYFTLGK